MLLESAKTVPTHQKLFIFDTHPIQYRSPVFRELYATHKELKVFFFNPQFDATHWWFNEIGQIPTQNWRLPLTDGFPNETLHTSRLGFAKTYRKLRQLFLTERPDAVLIYGYYQWEHWLIRWLTWRFGVALLFVGETFDDRATGLRRWLKQPLLHWFFSGIHQFITIGTKTRYHYLQKGISEAKLTDAKYCTDNSFFKLDTGQAEELRQKWRARLGIPSGALVVLFVGRLVERKRPFDVLKIHGLLSDEPLLYSVVAGNGLLEDPLRAQAAKESRFLMLGFQDQHQVRECYYGADLLIVPSEYESWGLVVNEAFSCGLAALVTDKCGVSGDLVIDGETGYSFPVGDCEKAAGYIRMCLSDRAKLETLKTAARQKVNTEYSIGQFTGAILKSLGQAVAR